LLELPDAVPLAPEPVTPSAASTVNSRRPVVLHTRVITRTGGGPDKTILNSPRFLADAGYHSVCVFLHPPNDPGFQTIRERAAAAGAPLEEIDDRGPLDWRIVPKLLRLCRQLQVDVWHAHDTKTNLLGLLVARIYPMRLVTTTHGWVEYTPRTRLYYHFDRWTLPRYERVICVSEDLLCHCRSLGVPEGKLQLIENAIDTAQFQRSVAVADAKQRIGWPARRLLVGAAGRLSGEKAFDVLIRAIHELLQRGVDVGLVIAGDGVARESLQRIVDELGMQDRVQLLGFQSDLRSLYEAMDIFVLSSLREGLPNVLLEAMSMEVPVVATRIAGVPRLILHNDNGWLVPAGEQSALANAIGSLLESSPTRARLAAAGRQTIEERYCFAARMKKVAAIYDALLYDSNDVRPKE
jgi:glycosyltransferase involved in cell wall biosynthesis